MKDQLHFTIKEDKIYLIELPLHVYSDAPKKEDSKMYQEAQKAKDNAVLVSNQDYVYNEFYKKYAGVVKFNDAIYTLTGYKVEIKKQLYDTYTGHGEWRDVSVSRYNKSMYLPKRELAVISPIEPEENKTIHPTACKSCFDWKECFEFGCQKEETKSDKPDFDKMARKVAAKVLAIPASKILPDDTIIHGYVTGCEKIWNDYVIPIRADFDDQSLKVKRQEGHIKVLQKELAELKASQDVLHHLMRSGEKRGIEKGKEERDELKKELDRAKELLEKYKLFMTRNVPSVQSKWYPSYISHREEIESFLKEVKTS